ncbi:MAG: hypothetical protein PVJ76_11820 [Gemmatimonadota bacterium]|jgi:hypothetical protein
MNGKWRVMGIALLVALSISASPLHAQRGLARSRADIQRPGGPNLGQSVELALENQEKLELSQDQVAQLQEMKTVLDSEVAGLAEEMKGVRESIWAGEVDRDEGFQQIEALRGRLITASAPLMGRVQEILTVEQHNKLQPMVRRGRPGLGRAAAVAGFRGSGTGLPARGLGVRAPSQQFGRGRAAPGDPGRGGVGRFSRPGLRGVAPRSAPGWRLGVGGYIGGDPGGEGATGSDEPRNLP